MRRRDFLGVVGVAAAPWPLVAIAQRKPPSSGFLGPASAATMGAWTAAFVQRMRELGWIEGRTVAFEYRWGDGHGDRLTELATELVRLKPDVIVTTGTGVPPLRLALLIADRSPEPRHETKSAGSPPNSRLGCWRQRS
jgi:putative tryptophan/tyrosine transport system substrate-binding protein